MVPVNAVLAQQTESTSGDLQLNLEQFPDAQVSPAKEELELNLEQFEKTDDSGNPDSTGNLELNLEQFDNKGQSNTNIGSGNSESAGRATRVEKSDTPTYNYRQIFLVGGAVFLVFLYFLSRRRKNRR